MAKNTNPTNSVDPKQAQSPIAKNTTLSLIVPWSEVALAYQAVITKASKNLKVDGFRKGHIPPTIAQEYLNHDALVEETARQVVPEKMPKLIEESKIDLAAQPEIQIKSATQGEDWQFDIILAPKPQIDVNYYQKIVKTAKKDGQKKWQESQKALESEKKKTAAKKSDQSTTELTASDQSSSEGSVEHSNHDHSQNHESDSPEKTSHQEENFLLQAIYTQLVMELKPQIPELLVRQQAREELEALVKRLQEIKMTLDDYLKQTKQTFEDLSEQLTARVLGQLQLAFILQTIAKQAKIDVTEAEIDHEIDTLPDAQVLVANRANPRMRTYLRDSLLQNKIIDHLLSIK